MVHFPMRKYLTMLESSLFCQIMLFGRQYYFQEKYISLYKCLPSFCFINNFLPFTIIEKVMLQSQARRPANHSLHPNKWRQIKCK